MTQTASSRYDDRRMTKACLNCGKPFVLPKCNDWREHCCSSECKTEVRQRKKENSELLRTRQCITCGKSFIARGTQIRDGQGRYCSNKCSIGAMTAGRSQESYAKSSASLRRSIQEGRYSPPKGASHHQWTGGKPAAVARQIEKSKTPEGRQKRKAYLKANPEKPREWSHKRSSGKVQKLPYGTVPRIGELQRWKCAICAVSVREKYHVDHIMPLAKGGEHTPANLQLLCPSCNVRKSAKHPVDYMQSRGFLL